MDWFLNPFFQVFIILFTFIIWIDAMHDELGPVEREVYDFIKRSGEVITKHIPQGKAGAIPSLVNKGLLEVVKRSLSPWSRKKIKFVKVVDNNKE